MSSDSKVEQRFPGLKCTGNTYSDGIQQVVVDADELECWVKRTKIDVTIKELSLINKMYAFKTKQGKLPLWHTVEGSAVALKTQRWLAYQVGLWKRRRSGLERRGMI